MSQIFVGGDRDSALSNSANRYFCVNGKTVVSSTEYGMQSKVPCDGVLSNLRVRLIEAPGAGKSYTFAVFKNVTITGLWVALSDSEIEDVDVDTLAVSAGDVVTVRCAPSGTPTVTNATFSMKFTPTTSGETTFMSTTGANNLTSGNFVPLVGMRIDNSDMDNRCVLMPCSGTIKSLYVKCYIAPGEGKSRTFTMYKNTTAQSLVVTVSDDATENQNTANTFTVAAGDVISLYSIGTGTPANSAARFGLCFVPDVEGNFVFNANHNDMTNNWFIPIHGNKDGGDVEDLQQQVGSACTIKAIYIRSDVAPGAGDSITFTLRIDGVSQALTDSLSGASEVAANYATDITVTDYDLLSTLFNLTGTPAACITTCSYLGYLSDAVGWVRGGKLKNII